MTDYQARRRQTLPLILVLGMVLAVLFRSGVAAESSPGRTLLPDDATPELFAIELSGEMISNGVRVYRVSGQLWLPSSLLEEHDIDVPDLSGRIIQTPFGEYMEVTGLPFISAQVDASRQAISLTPTATAYTQKVLGGVRAPVNPPMESIPALFVNYSLAAFKNDRDEELNAFLDTGFTTRESVFSSSFLNSDLADDHEIVRLETAWVKDFQNRRERLTVGDARATRADGSDLGVAYRFGGVQWGTELQIDPNLVTYPLPTLYGEAATQSTVDLFVNESLRFHTETSPGPFQIDQPPLTNGAGEVQVRVTDLLGREQIIVQPYYISTRLLSKGLSDYQVNIGELREEFGTDSNEYGDKFIAGRYRRGLTDNLTAQALAEWSDSHELVGVSTIATIPRLGVGSAGISASDSTLGTGTQVVASIERQSARYGFGVRIKEFDRSYVQIGSPGRGSVVKEELSTNIRFGLGRKTNASLIYTRRRNYDLSSVNIFSVALTRNMGRKGAISLAASVITGEQLAITEDGTELEDFRNKSISATYTRLIGNRRTVSVKHRNRKRDKPDSDTTSRSTVTLRKSVPSGLGKGYSFRVDRDHRAGETNESGSALFESSSLSGLYRIGGTLDKDFYSANASADGSVLFANRNVFFQRPLRDGFALVDTGGYPGINVYRENMLAAETNDKGLAVITGLQPYNNNRIRIRAAELPINVQLRKQEETVVPYYRGGVLTDFGVRREYGVLVRLVDAQGEDLPVATMITAVGTGRRFPVAQRGEVYITDINNSASFVANFDQLSCKFAIDGIEFTDDTIARVGPLECDLK